MTRIIFWGILLILQTLFMTNINGQVTIGSSLRPNSGALLDLKEKNEVGQNSTRGLLLPRVKLTDPKSLKDMGVSDEEHRLHTGLMVYNVNQDLCNNIKKGLALWNGSEWDQLATNGDVFEATILHDNRIGDIPQKYHIGHFVVTKPDGDKFDAGWWTLENMRATKFDSEATNTIEPIQLVTKSADRNFEIPFYTYPNYDSSLASEIDKHGYYYSSRAIYNGWDMDLVDGIPYNTPPRVIQGICPNGWRVPTYEDWINLLTVLFNEDSCTYGTTRRNDGARLVNAISSDENVDGVAGTSRSVDEGGFSSRLRIGYPMEQEFSVYPSTYPTPYRDSPSQEYFKSLGYLVFNIGTFGVLNPRIEVAYNIAPVRCVKGPVPTQYEYK